MDKTTRHEGKLVNCRCVHTQVMRFLSGAARVVDLFLDVLEERLEQYGWKLVLEKSPVWIPSLDLLEETRKSKRTKRDCLSACQDQGMAIKALGSAADGEFSVFIGEQKVGSETL